MGKNDDVKVESNKPGFPGIDAIINCEYNNCQFYSNFEIGSLDFFRGEKNSFLYEHLGDAPVHLENAPVHTSGVSMFLPQTKIWFFRDIGYPHGICEQQPPRTPGHICKTPIRDKAKALGGGCPCSCPLADT